MLAAHLTAPNHAQTIQSSLIFRPERVTGTLAVEAAREAPPPRPGCVCGLQRAQTTQATADFVWRDESIASSASLPASRALHPGSQFVPAAFLFHVCDLLRAVRTRPDLAGTWPTGSKSVSALEENGAVLPGRVGVVEIIASPAEISWTSERRAALRVVCPQSRSVLWTE